MGFFGGDAEEPEKGQNTSTLGDYVSFGGAEPEEESCIPDCCPEFTMQQRVMGYLGCFALGVLLNFLVSLESHYPDHSTFAKGAVALWTGQADTFGVVYCLGEFSLLAG